MTKYKLLISHINLNELLVYYFTRQGYECHSARTPKDVIQKSLEVSPHLIILHTALLSGFERNFIDYDTGKELRSNPLTRHIPILFLMFHKTIDTDIELIGGRNGDRKMPHSDIDLEDLHQVIQEMLQDKQLKY